MKLVSLSRPSSILFFFLKINQLFKLEDNCFTMLYWFLLYNNVQKSKLYT